MKKSYLDDPQDTGPQEMKDQDILRASLAEPALFAILVEKYHDPLYRAAFKIVRNPEESEDIVQEAFVKMYKNAEKFQKLEGIEFKSWAYKVTINNAITHYRKLVLASYYFGDKSYQTIAKEEEISIPTLKMRLFRAKRIFKKLLDEDATLI